MPSRRDPEDGNVSRLASPVCETGATTEIHRCLADFLIHSIADAIQSASAPVIFNGGRQKHNEEHECSSLTEVADEKE